MRAFYKKVAVSLVALLLLSGLVAYVCFERTFLHIALLPAGNSSLPWHTFTDTDAIQGGSSRIVVDDETYSLNFAFTLSHQAQYPLARVAMVFGAEGAPTFIDLSKYDQLSFTAKCAPANIVMFAAFTFEDKLSVVDDPLTYRAPATFFSCNEQWQRVVLDLTRLETPQWWLDTFDLELSEKAYTLDKVSQLTFSSSFQSPFNTESQVQLQAITLGGRDWFYLYVLGGFLFIAWSAYGLWFFRAHTRAVTEALSRTIQRDRPFIAYQQLTVEPHRGKEKSAILHFLATGYANQDLTLESMASSVGISRTKINDILKSELGLTFTGYLNKLRLTEAARLLSSKEDANIAEIAYSVGYRNVSYFNKLFKEEYHCTPKTFKQLCEKSPGDPQT